MTGLSGFGVVTYSAKLIEHFLSLTLCLLSSGLASLHPLCAAVIVPAQIVFFEHRYSFLTDETNSHFFALNEKRITCPLFFKYPAF